MNAKTSKLNASTATNSAKLTTNDPRVIAAQNVRNATQAADGALVEALRVGIASRFVPEALTLAGYADGSAKTLASEWNAGAAVAAIIGEKGARDVINAAVKAAPVGTYRAVLAALREVKERAKTAGLKTATAAQAKTLTKDVAFTAKRSDEARRAKLEKMRGQPRKAVSKVAEPVAVDHGDPIAHALSMCAAALPVSHAWQDVHASLPVNRQALARQVAKAAADFAELAQMLAKALKA